MLLDSALEVDMDLQQEYDELIRTAGNRPRNKIRCLICGAEHEFLDDGEQHQIECGCDNTLFVQQPLGLQGRCCYFSWHSEDGRMIRPPLPANYKPRGV